MWGRPVEFNKRLCRMSLRPKNALSILGVYTHVGAERLVYMVPKKVYY